MLSCRSLTKPRELKLVLTVSWLNRGAVAEILVVDGGSSDGTQSVVEDYGSRDRRVQLIDASPVPVRLDGKSMGPVRGVGKDRSTVKVGSLYRCGCMLLAAVGAFLAGPCRRNRNLNFFGCDPPTSFQSRRMALLHPSLLTTLVYRFGMPGKATRNRHHVQANGQCFISPRDTLLRTDAFRAAQLSFVRRFYDGSSASRMRRGHRFL